MKTNKTEIGMIECDIRNDEQYCVDYFSNTVVCATIDKLRLIH